MIAERVRWLRLDDARLDELAEGALMRVRVAGRQLVIVRVDGRLHALRDRCPHQGKPLSGGWCEQGRVVCPWHRYAFDPATGHEATGACAHAEVVAMRRREGGWWVGFPYTTIRLFGVDLW